MQIKTTMKYHFTSTRIATIKNSNKCWPGYGEIRTLKNCWWKCNVGQLLWKKLGKFLKRLNIELTYDPLTIPLIGKKLPTN